MRQGPFLEETALLAPAGPAGERHSPLLPEEERLRRVLRDFPLSEEDLLAALRPSIPDIGPEDIACWREQGWIRWCRVGDQVLHWRRTLAALFRFCPEAIERRRAAGWAPAEETSRAAEEEREHHLRRVMAEAPRSASGLCCPIRFRVNHTLTVRPGVVPPGERIRCWLPFPREEGTQPPAGAADALLLSTRPAEHVLAPPDAAHRSVFMEQPAAPAGEPTVFGVTHEFTAWAWWREIDIAAVRPHDERSDLWRRFTAEEPPHVVFTPTLRALAREITGGEPNPYLRARRIYEWITAHVRYALEVEYSTIPSLTERAISHRAGDCGVQAMLFIALCRCAGVPARWESGWYLQPLSPNMHDWARFHVEPFGWLWADPSIGARTPLTREFLFGGIDAFRLAVNAAVAQPLTPPKRHPRSDTVDFQRGEVEWAGGNLYFDAWDYEVKSEIL